MTQRVPITKDGVMETPSVQASTRSCWLRRGLMCCGWLVGLIVIYVASIGPLAYLESKRFGSDDMWSSLHQTVYRPIFTVWWHVPKWLSDSLRWYSGKFEWHPESPWFLKRYFGTLYNDCGRTAVILCRLTRHPPATKKEADIQRWDGNRHGYVDAIRLRLRSHQ